MPPKGVGRPWSSRVPASRAYCVLVLGLLLGWGLAIIRPAPLRAGGRRSFRRIDRRHWPGHGPLRRGKQGPDPARSPLLPRLQGRAADGHDPFAPSDRRRRSHYLGAFAERDLVADFKLDLDNGPRPHFLMTTGVARHLWRGLGAALRLRDDHEPARGLPDPSAVGRNELQARGSSSSRCARWPSLVRSRLAWSQRGWQLAAGRGGMAGPRRDRLAQMGGPPPGLPPLPPGRPPPPRRPRPAGQRRRRRLTAFCRLRPRPRPLPRFLAQDRAPRRRGGPPGDRAATWRAGRTRAPGPARCRSVPYSPNGSRVPGAVAGEDLAGRVLEEAQPLVVEPQPERGLVLVVDRPEDLLVHRRGVEREEDDRHRDQRRAQGEEEPAGVVDRASGTGPSPGRASRSSCGAAASATQKRPSMAERVGEAPADARAVDQPGQRLVEVERDQARRRATLKNIRAAPQSPSLRDGVGHQQDQERDDQVDDRLGGTDIG